MLGVGLELQNTDGTLQQFHFPRYDSIFFLFKQMLYQQSTLFFFYLNYFASDFGAALQPLRRLLPARYADGETNTVLRSRMASWFKEFAAIIFRRV